MLRPVGDHSPLLPRTGRGTRRARKSRVRMSNTEPPAPGKSATVAPSGDHAIDSGENASPPGLGTSPHLRPVGGRDPEVGPVDERREVTERDPAAVARPERRVGLRDELAEVAASVRIVYTLLDA